MKTRDFLGFRFGQIHSSDLHLDVISTSNRYEPRVLPTPSDVTIDVPGNDGQYYFGSTYKNREITVEVAFENVSENDYRKIRQLFATDKLQDLVFDEEPYKTWRAKLKSKPEFKSMCFNNPETGERVYKGDGKLSFVCYFPYAFGFNKYIINAADYYMLNPPKCIIQENQADETFVKKNNEKKDYHYSQGHAQYSYNMGATKNDDEQDLFLPQDIKYHYNVNPSDYEGNEILRDKAYRNKENRGWTPNNNTPWKTGFPTYEQVEAGELYFDTPHGEKSIIDVRGYWDNVPEWQSAAKLLTTPTLDFEQELIYLPQYSKTDFINMETGFDNSKSMIGARMLVYNPGDLPVDWEIKLDENKRSLWSCRGGAKFRIRRFNVERLPIPCAVDWCGLTTYEIEDNETFKYGNKYFKRRSLDIDSLIQHIENNYGTQSFPKIYMSQEDWEKSDRYNSDSNSERYYTKDEVIKSLKNGKLVADKEWHTDTEKWTEQLPYYSEKIDKNLYSVSNPSPQARNIHSESYQNRIAFNLHLNESGLFNNSKMVKGLGLAHPHYCYYVEPIPRDRLGHYIKLFYWQTIQWRGNPTIDDSWGMTDNWKDLIPSDLLEEKTETINGRQVTKYYIKDISNPIVDLLNNFAAIHTKYNSNTKKVENYITMDINDENISTERRFYFREIYKDLDFEKGIELANRYEEQYNECIDELEQYELYWKTLKILLNEFKPIINEFTDNVDTEIDRFIDSYINHPPEFMGADGRELGYNEVIFNGYKMPEWITDDYLEIDQFELSNVSLIKEYLKALDKNEDAIFTGHFLYYTENERNKLKENENYTGLIKKMDSLLGVGGCINDLLDDYYYLNSEKRMLYTTENPYGMEFIYKPNKNVQNEAIRQGKWFKLPPGWSLISIEPIIDEKLWGGKRWKDARPYDWGYSGDLFRNRREVQQLYDVVYGLARQEFLKIYTPQMIEGNIIPLDNLLNQGEYYDEDVSKESPIDEYLKFRVWYEDHIERFKSVRQISNSFEISQSTTPVVIQHNVNNVSINYFEQSYYQKLRNDGEYTLLRIINSIWQLISPYYTWTVQKGVYIEPDDVPPAINGPHKPTIDDYDISGLPLRCINGAISDWWWYACNYFWSNFPPLYWAAADMFNKMMIKYIPLFY